MNNTAAIVRGEFIGLKAKVVKSSNTDCQGISGHVVDETLRTLTIKQHDENKVIAKQDSIFQFTLQDGTIVEVNGDSILGRPEDRVKRRLKRRW